MIIFFYGPDNFKLSRATTEIKNKFIRDIDPSANSLILIDGQNADSKTINSKLGTGSLFAEKRFILITEIFKNKKLNIFSDLLSQLEKISTDDNLIIVFKEEIQETKNQKPNEILKGDKKKLYEFLKKQKYSQEFKKISGNALKLFIKQELENYNKKISGQAAEDIINYFGDDLWTISNELKKLAFSSDEEMISQKNVKNIIKEQFHENIFALIDAISTKNKKIIFSLLEQQKQAGLDDEYILAMIRNHIKNLLLIKLATKKTPDSLKIASQLKIHPFVAKKGLAQSRNFNESTLKNYLNKLVEIDFMNKNGNSDTNNELFLFLSNL